MRTQLAEIARLNAMLDALDIILDCDPRNTTDRGLEQPAASQEAAPTPPNSASRVKPSASKSANAGKANNLRAIAEDREHFARVMREADQSLKALQGDIVKQGSRYWAASSRLYLM